METFEYPDSGIVVDYTYDENGDIVSVDTNTDFSISYDKVTGEDVNTTNITYTLGDEEYRQIDVVEYDETEGKKTDTQLITGDKVEQTYDEENSLIERYVLQGNEYCNNVTFNDNAKADTITYSDGTVISYTYNINGFTTKVKVNDVLVNEYEYDLLDRLVCEKDADNNRITHYTYDLYDNMTNSITYEYNEGNIGDVISENVYEYSNIYGDQLIRFNGLDIRYDESGKPLNYYNGYKYTWSGNRLISADNGGKKIELTYDNNGKVIQKTVNGVPTVYSVEGTDYIAEITNGKQTVYMYDSSANLIGFVYEGNAYYYAKNANDDIIRVMDSNNEFVCGYEYDAWGNIVEITGDEEIARLNKFRYRGYYYDEDMGLYYLHSRYYDSVSGRFISTDDIEMMVYNEDNLNLYAYCHSNPVCYFDPEGTSEKVCIMSLNCWKSESRNIGDDFREYYDYTTCKVDYMFSDNMNDYEKEWNALSGYSIVVFNTHGTPRSLGNDLKYADKNRLSAYEIDELKYKSVSTVILLGCNAGHYDYVWSNVAYAFCKRISGCVVASDGIVNSGWINSIGKAKFKSEAYGEFYKYCETKRDNHGWVIYKNKPRNNNVYCYWDWDKGEKTLTIDWIMEWVEWNCYFK